MIRLFPLVLLVGCVQAPIAPNLKFPDLVQDCPKLTLPPIPQKVTLTIDGDTVHADEGGEQLLRSYVAARQFLRGVRSTAPPSAP